MNKKNTVVRSLIGYILVVIIAFLIILAIAQGAGAQAPEGPYMSAFEPGNIELTWNDIPRGFCPGAILSASVSVKRNGYEVGYKWVPSNFFCSHDDGIYTLKWNWAWDPDKPGIYTPNMATIYIPYHAPEEVYISPTLSWLEGFVLFAPVVVK